MNVLDEKYCIYNSPILQSWFTYPRGNCNHKSVCLRSLDCLFNPFCASCEATPSTQLNFMLREITEKRTQTQPKTRVWF